MMRLLLLALWAASAHGALFAQVDPAESATIVPGMFAIGDDSVAVDEGSFVVPANRTSGSTARLTLRFVRFRTTAALPSSPIVFLSGGPGDAATRAFRGMPSAFLDELRAIADVIAFDQRGTGTSEPLQPLCAPGAGAPLDSPTDPTALLVSLRAQLVQCLADAPGRGIDVGGLTTAESADDLEALRIALGTPRLSLLAGSYGTHLALATARQHPNAINRMVLLGVEAPDNTFKDPERVDEVLDVIGRARRPSLLDDVRTLRERLAATPASITAPGGITVTVGAWDLQRWVADALDTVPEIDAMLDAIPPMLEGNYLVLARWAHAWRRPRPLNLMHLAVDCASYASPARLAEIERSAPDAVLGDAINHPMPELCDIPGLPRLPASFREPIQSGIPALLISGTFDGRTPPENAKAVAAGMPNAELLVIDGASHGLFREAAALQALVRFLGGT